MINAERMTSSFTDLTGSKGPALCTHLLMKPTIECANGLTSSDCVSHAAAVTGLVGAAITAKTCDLIKRVT